MRSVRYWLRTPWRSFLLVIAFGLVVALFVSNSSIIRSTFWFAPPGVALESDYYTLGQRSAAGRFLPIAKADLARLNSLGFSGEYAYYRPEHAEVSISGGDKHESQVGLVSTSFFPTMGIRDIDGRVVSASIAAQGAVVSHRFWKDQLAGQPNLSEINLSIAGNRVSVVKVLSDKFIGLGDAEQSIWLPEAYLSLFLRLDLPGAPIPREELQRSLAAELPLFFGILKTDDASESRARLQEWSIRKTASIDIETASGSLKLGFDSRDNTPAVLQGVDIEPQRTKIVRNYLGILASLSLVIGIIGVSNMAAFFVSRTIERQPEISVRVAVGATRRSLLLMFASEISVFLIGVLAIGSAAYALHFQAIERSPSIKEFVHLRGVSLAPVDLTVAALLLLSVACIGIMIPWISAGRGHFGRKHIGQNVKQFRLRLFVTTAQWVLIFIVCSSAVASSINAYKLAHANWGRDVDVVVVPLGSVSDPSAFAFDLLGRQAAAFIDTAPLHRLENASDVVLRSAGQSDGRARAYFNPASLEAMRLLEMQPHYGRLFQRNSETEVVVSTSLVAALGSTPEQVVGTYLSKSDPFSSDLDVRYTVVGVVPDVRYDDIRADPEHVVYLAPPVRGGALLLPVKETAKIGSAVERAATRGDKGAGRALSRAQTTSAIARRQVQAEYAFSIICASYLGLTLLLVLLGLISQAQTELAARSQELALRVALGARLRTAALELLRAPILAVGISICLCIMAALAAFAFGVGVPLLDGMAAKDVALLATASGLLSLCFIVVLVVFAVSRLRSSELAQQLRKEH